ncbi:hypothetical protein BHM03_00005881, partial [Ensete ventricosum]
CRNSWPAMVYNRMKKLSFVNGVILLFPHLCGQSCGMVISDGFSCMHAVVGQTTRACECRRGMQTNLLLTAPPHYLCIFYYDHTSLADVELEDCYP